jgi:hypothetical protein
MAERDDYVRNRKARWDDYMYEQTPTIGRRRYLLYEETVDATDRKVCKGEVQCPLNLPAKLLCFPFDLPPS